MTAAVVIDWIVAALCLGGGAFSVIAAVGIIRLPDVFMRMHASTKAGTLGSGLILIAGAIVFDTTGAVARSLGALIFLLVTAPVAAHMIGRAAYYSGARLSPRTWIDERSGLAPAAAQDAETAPKS